MNHEEYRKQLENFKNDLLEDEVKCLRFLLKVYENSNNYYQTENISKKLKIALRKRKLERILCQK